MKLRIRRAADTLHFEADIGDGNGYVAQKTLTVPGMPTSMHAAVTSTSSIGAWLVQLRSEA